MEINQQFLDVQNLKSNPLDKVESKNIKDDKALREVANNFEAFFMNQILETSLKTSSIAGESAGSDIIKSMYTDAISQQSAGSLGISDMLYNFLSEKKS